MYKIAEYKLESSQNRKFLMLADNCHLLSPVTNKAFFTQKNTIMCLSVFLILSVPHTTQTIFKMLLIKIKEQRCICIRVFTREIHF